MKYYIYLIVTFYSFASFGAAPLAKVCDRTPVVRDALVHAANKTSCSDVAPDDLHAIKSLLVGSCDQAQPNYLLHSSDFGGLTGLTSLTICSLVDDTAGWLARFVLSDGLFSEIPQLESLDLHAQSGETNLPLVFQGDVFRGLVHLRSLALGEVGGPDDLQGLGLERFSKLGHLLIYGHAQYDYELAINKTFTVTAGSGKGDSCDNLQNQAEQNLMSSVALQSEMCQLVGGTLNVGPVTFSDCRQLSFDPDEFAQTATVELTCRK